MPRTKKFTESHVRKAKVGRTHVFDVQGLYLFKSPKGVKRYLYRYTVPRQGRVTETSVGRPGLSLNKAKVVAAKYRELLNDGVDPQEAKRWHHAESMTFAQLAEQWIGSNRTHVYGLPPSKRLQEAKNLLLVHGKPLSDLVLKDITPEKVHSALAPLWDDHPDLVQRARLMIEHVLDYAKVKRLRAGENPARWRGNLVHLFTRKLKTNSKHHGSMPYPQLPEFLRELRTHRGSVAMALEFTILTAVRSSEALQAQWSEIDWVQKIWTIPGPRMKARKDHRVPLSDRAVELLKRQQERAVSQFVFTGNLRDQPLAERSMYFLLRTMVPKVTVHGFRASFRNWAAHSFPRDRDLAELCLGHTVKGQTEGAYWTDDMLEQRRPIMEAWASYCG